MPPPKALAAPSSSREVVPVGPQHIQVKHGRPRRNELGQLPTTARALVLRNGKHGAMGAGEVFSEKFISAPEKLYWLGEDYRAKLEAGTTVMRPFDLDHAQRIADSQCNAYVDDILALKSPDTFYRDITEQVFAYLPSDEPDPSALKDRENVASAVMSRIHNLHMLASAWKIIRNRLEFLEREGLRNVTVKDQLLANEELRMEYLALYDMVAELETVLQTRLSLLSQASDHYSQYFRTLPVAEGDFAAFNWENLRPAYRSFIDHIVIELCLPNSKYQKYVLTTILSEALDELPKERRNFSKAMFDAVGDLRNAAELLEILDVPLLALRELGEQLKSQPRLVPEELKDWRAAQVHSEHVLNITVDKDLDIIFPLEQAKKKNVIDVLWRRIDSTCEENADETFWELWMLDDVRTRIAYWGVSPSDIDNSRALIPGSKNTVGKNNKMMITNGYDSDGSHGSMPSLETASDSYEDEDEEDESEALTDEEIEDSNDEGSEYDSDVEEEFRFRHREAMDFASTNPDVFDHTKNVDEGFLSESDRKNNPFLKLLGSLRGRMFRTNPTLKTTKDEIPYQRTGVQPRSAPSRPAAAKATQTKTTTTGEGNRTVTVEEVEDEDEIEEKKKKKKKKKPKKKKPAATVASPDSLGAAATTPQSASSPPTSSPPRKATLTPAKPAPAPASAKKTEQASRNVLGNASRTSFSTLASESTTYLPAPQVAQSARSYLQEEGPKEKVKVKSRAPADLQPVEEKKGRLRNLISKFSRPSKPTKTEEAKEKSAMGQAFAKLSKKSTAAMAQILSTKDTTKHPPMRWDHFVKVMIEMGFHVDGSTAGSSVRFDPPDANTRSISFHKPHPEAHIEPVTLREWGKRLKETYGWSEDIFEKHRRA